MWEKLNSQASTTRPECSSGLPSTGNGAAGTDALVGCYFTLENAGRLEGAGQVAHKIGSLWLLQWTDRKNRLTYMTTVQEMGLHNFRFYQNRDEWLAEVGKLGDVREWR